MRAALLLCGLVLAARGAAAQEVRKVGDFEELSIVSGGDAKGWGASEATMTVVEKGGHEGRPALRFHIDVDHKAGERNYPIGWPRALADLKEDWRRDWSAFDMLRLRIRADTSRDALPKKPLGLILYTPDKAQAFHRTLTELRKGQWTEIVIPLWEIPRHEKVTRIQLFISESDYRHGDVLDFTIDDIRLVRHAKPHLSDVTLRPSILFSDRLVAVCSFRVLGIPKGKTEPARLALLHGGATVREEKRTVGRGAGEIVLALATDAKPLEPGAYIARLSVGDGAPVERTLEIVETPWK